MAPKAENDPKAWSKASASIVALTAAQTEEGFTFEWLFPKQAFWQFTVGYGLEEREEREQTCNTVSSI